MHTVKKIFFGIAIIVLALSSEGWAAGEPKYSGFLDDYTGLSPDPERRGAFSARAQYKPGEYTKIIIDPVEIWLDPDSEYKGIKPDELKAIADRFTEMVLDVAKDFWVIVDKPGPGVIRARFAITKVVSKKPKRKARDFTPIGVIGKGVKNAAGKNYSLENAVLEAEMVDAQTHVRLAALVDSTIGYEEGKKKKGKRTWKDVEKTMKYYAERWRRYEQEARARK